VLSSHKSQLATGKEEGKWRGGECNKEKRKEKEGEKYNK